MAGYLPLTNSTSSRLDRPHLTSVLSIKLNAKPRNRRRFLLLTWRWKLERIMRYVLGLVIALGAFGSIPASSEEFEMGVSLASLDSAATVGSARRDRSDDERNIAMIKEGESESPEIVAVIERNREDRERTVVIDR